MTNSEQPANHPRKNAAGVLLLSQCPRLRQLQNREVQILLEGELQTRGKLHLRPLQRGAKKSLPNKI